MKGYSDWLGHKMKVFERIEDEDYGIIYYAHIHWDEVPENGQWVYIINDTIITDQKIIDELDDKYGIPVAERDIDL